MYPLGKDSWRETMVEDALNVIRSLIFFVCLVVASVYILLQRKSDSEILPGEKAERDAV
jgi:hypothetical protein